GSPARTAAWAGACGPRFSRAGVLAGRVLSRGVLLRRIPGPRAGFGRVPLSRTPNRGFLGRVAAALSILPGSARPRALRPLSGAFPAQPPPLAPASIGGWRVARAARRFRARQPGRG